MIQQLEKLMGIKAEARSKGGLEGCLSARVMLDPL